MSDGFCEFLARKFNAPDLKVRPLKAHCRSRIYRLDFPDRPPLFCKRRKVDAKAVDFLGRLPSTDLVPHLLAEETCSFEGERVFFYDWCELKSAPPEELSAAEFKTFSTGYRRFSELMQLAQVVSPPEDSVAQLERLKDFFRPAALSSILLRSLLTLRPRDFAFPEKPELVVTHGDLCWYNFGFTNEGRVVFVDFDSLAFGEPTDDFALLFARRFRRTLGFAQRRKLIGFFKATLSAYPFTQDQWVRAINRKRINCAICEIARHKPCIGTVLRVLRFDRRIRALLVSFKRHSGA